VLRPSIPLFDSLADHYQDHFSVLHRKAYDDLAWEVTDALLAGSSQESGCVIDAGCGVGRWAEQFLSVGHRVIGIEQAPAMAAAARARLGAHQRFTLLEAPIEEVELDVGIAELVIAMGSLQYTRDPAQALTRLAGWTRPGGWVVVVVDSLVALVLELLRADKTDEAVERLATRVGTWTHDGLSADMHLLDQAGLTEAMRQASLTGIEVRGLLVGASVYGLDDLRTRLAQDWEGQLSQERQQSLVPLLADLGKQLIAIGRRAPV